MFSSVAVILAMVALNALYVAAEFAAVSARRARIQHLAQSRKTASALLAIMQHPIRLDGFVATCQIGITVSSIVAGALGQASLTPILAPLFGESSRAVAVLIVLAVITMLQVVLGELLPKTAALRHPETMALALMPFMRVSIFLLRPFVWLFNGTAFVVMRALRIGQSSAHAHVHSPRELTTLYRASAAGGTIDNDERDMLSGVLTLPTRLAREMMTPHSQLVTTKTYATVGDTLAVLASSPHSRFPVADESGTLVGVVALKDLFAVHGSYPTTQIEELTTEAVEVSEFTTAPVVLTRLREAGEHCALVVDEYGSITGLVTLEDVLEEVFGEVRDEFDFEEDPISVSGDDVTVLGGVLLQTLADRFDIDITHREVDTVSGLLWHVLGRTPSVGDEVVFTESGLVLKVVEMRGRAVSRASFFLSGASQC